LKAYNGPTPTAWIGHHESGNIVEMRPTVDTGLAAASAPSPETARPNAEVKHRDRAVATATGGRDSNSDNTTRPKRTIIPPARYRD